jgi:hypothetical protein
MATAEFRSAVSEPWASLQPVRVGKLPPGIGTPDRYVIVDAGERCSASMCISQAMSAVHLSKKFSCGEISS